MNKAITYESKLAPYINGLIEEKQACGFDFTSEAKSFKNFDSFVLSKGFDNGKLDYNLVSQWCKKRPTECETTLVARINLVIMLASYLRSLGIEAYIAPRGTSKNKPVPYVLSRTEIDEFFACAKEFCIDCYTDKKNRLGFLLYYIMFHLYYYCGMRLNEAVVLEVTDVDLAEGIIRIKHSKGDKDRLVFPAKNVLSLLLEYNKQADFYYPSRQWFFPGTKEGCHCHKCTVIHAFNRVWEKLHGIQIKHPTIHSLRHTFVVHRIDFWVEEGKDLNVMIPYLQKYLGHSSVEETMYYYHSLDSQSKATRDCFEKNGIVSMEALENDII